MLQFIINHIFYLVEKKERNINGLKKKCYIHLKYFSVVILLDHSKWSLKYYNHIVIQFVYMFFQRNVDKNTHHCALIDFRSSIAVYHGIVKVC